VERVLAATETLAVATGVVNIWHVDARAVADTYQRLEAAYPGRFMLGVGAGHREFGANLRSPYQALVDYLDMLDERGVPTQRRVLAALGPRVLKLAAERSAGAYPFLVTPAYTRRARELVGPDAPPRPAPRPPPPPRPRQDRVGGEPRPGTGRLPGA
jgi:probable F420-dependent oxidoreductase